MELVNRNIKQDINIALKQNYPERVIKILKFLLSQVSQVCLIKTFSGTHIYRCIYEDQEAICFGDMIDDQLVIHHIKYSFDFIDGDFMYRARVFELFIHEDESTRIESDIHIIGEDSVISHMKIGRIFSNNVPELDLIKDIAKALQQKINSQMITI